ncbi:hypothetical protein SAMN06295912_10268 [Sphingomonas laterariae]|uniref:GDSL-like Lipase/Acylhydrolase family protein n=1 Tax=Edaphosphingomonas laterariae TaxID=861865 RepID=A0A239CAS5_9SPHN|nr:hypothetical protein [Sphingomonas laterariae]SNS16544.1 hypothetical protein SAMN06295912_10268 [Sphingomonas laterariae]
MPSTKISALGAASALGGGELLPAVQGGGNVAVTPTQLRAHALAGVPPLLARPAARLMVDGDSKRGEAVTAARWVNARTPIEATIGSHDLGVGGSTTATQASTGLTNATRMATMQATVAAQVASGWAVDMLMTIGTNDIVLAGLTPETVLANLRKYHNAFRAAGGRFLILMAVDPRTGLDATAARKFIALNRAYADYCTAIADAIWCDTAAWWLDPASTSFAPVGGATGAAFGMAADGLHGNAYGAYRKQYALGPILQALYRPRLRGPLYGGDSFNTADAVRGNILGTNGRMVALGGTNSITLSGSGSVSGTPPAGWTATGTLTGDLGLSFAVAGCPPLDAYAGSAGWQAVRLTFNGTPSATGQIVLTRNVVLPEQGAAPMAGSLLVNANALAGCHGIYLASVNTNPIGRIDLGAAGTPTAADQLPQMDGLLGLDLALVPTGNLNSGVSINIRWLGGVAMSGSIDLIGATWRRADAPPAAAA